MVNPPAKAAAEPIEFKANTVFAGINADPEILDLATSPVNGAGHISQPAPRFFLLASCSSSVKSPKESIVHVAVSPQVYCVGYLVFVRTIQVCDPSI